MFYFVDLDGDGGDEKGKGLRCNNCMVYMGFMVSWKVVREIVVFVVEKVWKRYFGYGVELVGYSFGGVVVMLVGLEMRVGRGWEGVRVVMFGELMVGNKGLVEFVDEVFGLKGDVGGGGEDKVYRRVMYKGDLVLLLLLREWGFRSYVGEIFIMKGDLLFGLKDLRLCEGDRDKDCLNGEDGDDEEGEESDKGWFREMVNELGGKEEGEMWEMEMGWLMRFKLW